MELREKFRELGYEGDFPEPGDEAVTQEDLQALGRDLVKVVNHAHLDLAEQIQALRDENIKLGAAVQELLRRSLPPSGSHTPGPTAASAR
jgi:hypothetical protein